MDNVSIHSYFSAFLSSLTDRKKSRGFGHIALLIDIVIISVLLWTLYLLINPLAMLSKAGDSTRKHDIAKIKIALEEYYNDRNCYPREIPFGNKWREIGVTYMNKVPQSPQCLSNPAYCYSYQVDTGQVCPQWNILYTKQETPKLQACPLQSFTSSCVPPNFDASWSCALSGDINCSYVSANPVLVQQ